MGWLKSYNHRQEKHRKVQVHNSDWELTGHTCILMSVIKKKQKEKRVVTMRRTIFYVI